VEEVREQEDIGMSRGRGGGNEEELETTEQNIFWCMQWQTLVISPHLYDEAQKFYS
jgi:hypothetical protein